MRDPAESAAAPAARCRNFRRGSFISIPPSLIGLFDHLVGAGEQSRRHVNAERLGSLEVDSQLELGRLLDRKVGRTRALTWCTRSDHLVHGLKIASWSM